jgi:hypothetical protein
MEDVILGSIMYLNTREVDNLLESIEGGLVEQFKETTRETKGKKGEGGIGLPGTDLGLRGGLEAVREEAREAVKKQTPVARLATLRKILIDNEYVQYIDVTDEEIRASLVEGSLVEVRGELAISAFGELVDIASQFLNLTTAFSGLFGELNKIDTDTEQAIRYFEHIASKGIAVYVQPEKRSTARRGFDFACILDPNALRVTRSELGGKVNVMGRVKKIPARNEVIYLYELIPGISLLLRGTDFKALLKKLSKSPHFSITERDLRLRYPSVLLTPIAMYS